MARQVVVHGARELGEQPHLRWWSADGAAHQVAPSSNDDYGPIFHVEADRLPFEFAVGADGDDPPRRVMPASLVAADHHEVWCPAGSPWVYRVRPRATEPEAAERFLSRWSPKPGVYRSATGGLTAMGATPLAAGGVLFSYFHPTAARVFVTGSFNGWAQPGSGQPGVVEMKRYRTWGEQPGLWLAVVHDARPGDEYLYLVYGGVPDDHDGGRLLVTDPYARQLGEDCEANHGVVIDPGEYGWHDSDWRIPPMRDAIFYELSVYGITAELADWPASERGRFEGLTRLIETGYFNELGVNVLALMPVHQTSRQPSPKAMGYDPIHLVAPEREYGSSHDLRRLIDTAHRHNLAVVMDVVFNHTPEWTLFWQTVLEHPREVADRKGGWYYLGETEWGPRIGTDKPDVQSFLIDIAKLLVQEYHADGFRVDGTNSKYTSHEFVLRLFRELRAFRPELLLIAENLPNEDDFMVDGQASPAQWSGPFLYKLKSLLCEEDCEDPLNGDETTLKDIFYFSRHKYARHTDHAINYTESHDEHSPARQVQENPELDHAAAVERKGRLAVFASVVALGEPLLTMGQEFNAEKKQKIIVQEWPADRSQHAFYQWTRRLLHLRAQHPGLRISGSDPIAEGTFEWVAGVWLPEPQNAGEKVIGWRAMPPEPEARDLVVLLNFEPEPVQLDVPFGRPGVWLPLADMDGIYHPLPSVPSGPEIETALRIGADGWLRGLGVPDSAGVIYQWVGD
ncbi:MAG: hypothetical protein HUU35_06545 [Armatimonadetes bacterium]|nr:hypothetical protein [Armatimonadota bacterium]